LLRFRRYTEINKWATLLIWRQSDANFVNNKSVLLSYSFIDSFLTLLVKHLLLTLPPWASRVTHTDSHKWTRPDVTRRWTGPMSNSVWESLFDQNSTIKVAARLVSDMHAADQKGTYTYQWWPLVESHVMWTSRDSRQKQISDKLTNGDRIQRQFAVVAAYHYLLVVGYHVTPIRRHYTASATAGTRAPGAFKNCPQLKIRNTEWSIISNPPSLL